MSDPVLVEVLRGDRVESRHRGAVVVCDAFGGVALAVGDVEQPVFPRSAVKAIQALPLVESGAANAFGFGDEELALACASHRGEAAHADLAASMLSRAGLDETDLECGSHWPFNQDAMVSLARSGGTPSQLHNNCSGKHSGFLCTCRHLRMNHRGYVGFDHPMQGLIREAMQDVTGADHSRENSAIDGCSIPTHAVPLKSLAVGFAKMATGEGLSPARAKAARRLLGACMAEPFFMSGSDSLDMPLMQAAPGRIFVKSGAEGMFCAALPELGLGMALKCNDGAGRAGDAIIAAVLARLLKADVELSAKLTEMANPVVPSRRGTPVGRIRPTKDLLS
ncbi:asparaginase [Mesorhizobium sp. VNQ89]|uniref:asparaginase n=1 Tax=Mesorhizobium quangtriensis TaxID=3157709 RepID=UPI0032B7858B